MTDGLVARYALDETSGSAALNSAPGSTIGAGVVEGEPSWDASSGSFAFSGGPDGSGNAIRLPNNVNRGLSSVSVDFDVWISPEQANYYMIYGIGSRAQSGAGERYLFGSGDSFHTVITPGGQSQEINIQPSGNPTLARGVWKHMTYTQTGQTGILYEDGVERARNTSVTTTPDQLGSTSFNYLGRSVYGWDPSFHGKLRDFRIYNRALSASEVGTLSIDVLKEATALDAGALNLGDLSALTSSPQLPQQGPNATSIAWTTSNAAVISSTGQITRGAEGSGPANATLTATVSRGNQSTQRAFMVTVSPRNDAADAQSAAAAITIPRLSDIRENITLPTEVSGAKVSWVSSSPSIISATGVVNRPANGAAAAKVSLTATARIGAASATREFEATVLPAPAVGETRAYLFPYFTGESSPEDERVRYAISNGNDALDWVTINDNKPVLESKFGERGLRDPFVIRSPQGDRFYMLATDLNAHRTGLDGSQVFGSRYIEVWESTDLVTWSEQRHVLVSKAEAGNTWAPEAYYDQKRGQFVVFWASNLYPSGRLDVPRDPGTTYNRMMYATTRDFVSFSEPQVWIDEQQPGLGNGTIDSTIMEEDGWFYRFTVTESSNIPRVDRTKDLYASITPGNNPWLGNRGNAWEARQSAIGFGQTYTGTSGRSIFFDEGEGTSLFRPNKGDVNGDKGVYAFIDQAPYYGGDGYVPFKASSLAAGDWTIAQNRNLPESARHGTVLPITTSEYEAILARYQPDRLITADDVALTTLPAAVPALPATVAAVEGRGTSAERDLGQIPVTWEAVDPKLLAAGSTLTVQGSIGEHGFVEAVVTVADVTVSVSSRCVAKKVTLIALARNGEDVPVTVGLASPAGARSLVIAPGKSSSVAFATRANTLPAGEVRVTATMQGGAQNLQSQVVYAPRAC
ncbi:immunoglobulin-like domain-containing protein [Microbacterium sp. VKM Ac-2923]|uniref:immunoglobulin-like domain-containing protein n=1 Tax=Microbacterium sp. VKM Ac-2923 TaxID=2929476 RepID=UPI001FB3604E|nr:immunoglobulin-like domain-containing protein [Microbacterium sp. VKM Ac-2923]MCJ1709474.1 1,4-beta-xylanase [Microbacterium sp. VKM Ac-2923]